MHMADALVSPAVAAGAGVAAAALIGVAAHKVKTIRRENIIPLMGVMGAFVFAVQMINFSILGTGWSGHVIGGVLLAAVLGPWAAFLTLCSVLIIQCLVFADGGLLALGCNILNMAATSCLIAYPLIYKPIAGANAGAGRIFVGALLASVVGLEIGALGVTAETELSGITALPTSVFLSFMLPIHLAIGAVEGVATGAVLCFVAKYRPETLTANARGAYDRGNRRRFRRLLVIFGAGTLVLASAFTWLASANPDGLEWSISKVAGLTEFTSKALPTAVMPEYNSTFAGVIGAVLVMTMLWAISTLLFHSLRRAEVPSRTKK